MSLVAAFWFVVGCAGLVLIGAAPEGLALLLELARESPLPAGFGGVGVGYICLAGAVVSAVAGRPGLALTALVVATSLVGLATLLILENGRDELTPGQAEILASHGRCLTAILGLALLAFGLVHALTASRDGLDRVVDGGFIALFGWLGLRMSFAIRLGPD